MPLNVPDDVRRAVAEHSYPLLFATLSGAHLYGFPSPDSDWDVRGCHVLPAEAVLGLDPLDETVEVSRKSPACDLDLVTHDAGKFLRLMLRPNGYVLEQIHSPLVVLGGPLHEELKELAHGCVTRHHVHHYLGFSRNQRTLLDRESLPRVKPLLYLYRVLLTGIHMMRTGTIECDLPRLAEEYAVRGVSELVASSAERGTLPEGSAEAHAGQLRALSTRLEAEGAITALPDSPRAARALSEFLVRVRLSR
jgi:predicted nucleotidyltransferase